MPEFPSASSPHDSAAAPADESTATPPPAAAPAVGGAGTAFEDAEYSQAVIDLLGAIAYGELSAFERLAEDAKLAPSVADKVAISGMAAAEFGHLEALIERLESLGADPYEAMAPFRRPIEEFHAHTHPVAWWEGLVKASVGDGLAADFNREIAASLAPSTRDLLAPWLAEAGSSALVVDRVRAAGAADCRLGGRLALWGRRLMGEALIQGQ